MITNSGTISGARPPLDMGTGTAIDMRGGNDTLNIRTGSVIHGLIDGGLGNDTISLSGTGTLADVVNFETLNVESGSWTVNGTQAYANGVNVFGGATVILNGGIDSLVTVLPGGRITGFGSVDNLVLGGTVAPGNGIGTLMVMSNATFQASSTYEVEVNAAGKSDTIIVAGNATLQGGTVQVLAAMGQYQPRTSYTILTTVMGNVSGRFGAVFSNLAFLVPELSYSANAVTLTLTRNVLTFQQAAITRNQAGVGAALDGLGYGNPLYNLLITGTVEEARQAFSALSGEAHAQIAGVIIDGSGLVRDSINDRLRQMSAANGGALAALAPRGSMVMSFAAAPAPTDPSMLAYAKGPRLRAAPIAPPEARVLALWGQAFGGFGRNEGDANAASNKSSTGGFLIGADATFDDIWRVGIAAGYSRTNVDIDGRASSGDVDSVHVAAYGGATFGSLAFRAGAAYANHNISSRRSIAFGPFGAGAEAKYDGNSGQAFGEVGYGITFGQVAFEPYAGLAWLHLDTDGFTESGGAAALIGLGNAYDVSYGTLGLRAATRLQLSDSTWINLRGGLGWRRAFGDVTPGATLAFASGSTPFTTYGAPLARDSLIVEAGLDMALTAQTSLGASYTGSLADRAQDHSFKANLAVKF